MIRWAVPLALGILCANVALAIETPVIVGRGAKLSQFGVIPQLTILPTATAVTVNSSEPGFPFRISVPEALGQVLHNGVNQEGERDRVFALTEIELFFFEDSYKIVLGGFAWQPIRLREAIQVLRQSGERALFGLQAMIQYVRELMAEEQRKSGCVRLYLETVSANFPADEITLIGQFLPCQPRPSRIE